MKILVVNGPNLNLLGVRDKTQYGSTTLLSIHSLVVNEFPKISFTFFQSNSEAEITTTLQNHTKFDGIILNPGAFSHTSVAIRDAVESIKIPIVEVHLSNISSRENFRKRQITTSKVVGYISGFKENSYLAGVYILTKMIESDSKKEVK
ncbi:MAG: type II 3-dehydroquinate dehydratase [Melioribacteraceae bacterium]